MSEFTTPMMQQYAQMKRENPDCILLFRLGDFYEMFEEDAYTGARVLDITLTGRPNKEGRVPMAGVPYHAIDSYLAKLVKAGYKVAICEQLTPPNSRGLIERKIVRIVTPGTLTDEKALEKKENNFLVAVAFAKTLVGLAAVDLGTGEFLVNQFPRTGWEKTVGDELSKLSPAECILSETSYNDSEILRTLTMQKGMNVFRFPSWERLAYRSTGIIKQHFGIHSLSSVNLEDKSAALEAAAVVLGYLSETQKDTLSHLSRITFLEENRYLQLDRSTIANLEIFSTIRDRNRERSVAEVLDHTATGMGGRLLRQWFIKPLNDRSEITARQDAVQYFIDHPGQREPIRKSLLSVIDIERLTSRLSLHQGGARDLIALKTTLEEIARISLPPETDDIVPLARFRTLCQSQEVRDMIRLIGRTILPEPAIDLKSGGIINGGIHAELDSLRDIVSHNKEWLEGFEKRERGRTGISSLKVRFNSVFGYYIEISKANLTLAPSDYVRKQTLVGGERFITEELKLHEEKILTASEKINRIEYEIWQQTLSEILRFVPVLQELGNAIGVVDCLLSFAVTAAAGTYCRPTVTDGDEITIVGGRHPVVETLLSTGEFTPNDCYLNTSSNQLMLITGPNMAGKSVYLRQVALIVLLSQMGSFVPAERATVGLVDRIFVRSGAADAITSGLSTFMVEMVETAHILTQASDKSLIIMDEIGRGTSTYDGISIAWAVAEYLVKTRKTGPKTLFATHYHELQELERRYPKRIANMQMAVAQNGDGPVFLHTLVKGGASHSYGVAVAKLAGIPDSIIERAGEILLELEHTHEVPAVPAEDRPAQKTDTASDVIQQIRATDIDAISPLEALNLLSLLKGKLDE
jgi:DNA mismatch repair protein MutS